MTSIICIVVTDQNLQSNLSCLAYSTYSTHHRKKKHVHTNICLHTNIHIFVVQISMQTKTCLLPLHKYVPWIGGDLKPDTREYSKLCVYEASFPPLLKHLLNCHSHLSNCIISFIFLLLCPEYESIMSCGCPPKLSLAP